MKVSSVLEDMVRGATIIQKFVQSLGNSVCKIQKRMCRVSKIYEAQNYSLPN